LTHEKMNENEIRLLPELMTELDYDFINCYLSDFSLLFNDLCKPLPILNTMSDLPFSYDLSGNLIRTMDEIPRSAGKGKFIIFSKTSNDEYSEKDLLPDNMKILNYDIHKRGKSTEECELTVPEGAISILLYNEMNNEKGDDLGDYIPNIKSQMPLEQWRNLDLVILGGTGLLEPDVRVFPSVENDSSSGQEIPDCAKTCELDDPCTFFNYLPERKIRVVNTGLYGEFVIVLNLNLSNSGMISNHNWEVIPTISVKPDSIFKEKISKIYKTTETEKN